MGRFLFRSEVLAFAALGIALPPAHAQTAPESVGIEEVVVTARKRAETLISAPVVVEAISGAELQRQGINTIDALARIAPSLLTGESGGSAQGGLIALRGLGAADGNPLADQAVAFDIDGVAITRSSIRRLSEMDVDQISILKGPQSLFFGRDSPAGVISIRSADPTSNYQGKLSAGYDFEGQESREEGYISGPINDILGFRIAASTDYLGGWLDNDAPPNSPISDPNRNEPKQHENAFRGTLKLDIGDFNAVLKAGYDSMRNNGIVALTQLISCPTGRPQLGITDDCTADGNVTRGQLGRTFGAVAPVFGDGSTFMDTTLFLNSLEMNYDVTDQLKLTSVSGYFYYSSQWHDTFNLSLAPTLLASTPNFNTREWSEEVRLTSSFEGPINFIYGLYYQGARTNAGSITYFNANKPTWLNNYYYIQNSDAYSTFAQLTWTVIPTVELAPGLRYSYEDKRLPVVLGSSAAAPQLAPATLSRTADHWTNLTPEFTATWRPSDKLTVYGSYKTGFLSGGFNGVQPVTGSDPHFGEEKIRGFEGGVKASLFDNQLRTDLALYKYVLTGLQVSTFPAGSTISRTINAGKAEMKGLDLSLTYLTPIQGLLFSGTFNWNLGQYDEFLGSCYTGQTQQLGCNAGTPKIVNGAPVYSAQNLSNTRLQRAPLWTGDVGLDYSHPIGWDLVASVSGDLNFSSSYLTDGNSKPEGVEPAFTLYNASVRLASSDNQWELALIGRNLTNVYYWVRSSDQVFTGSGTGTFKGVISDTGASSERGREIWLRATVKFEE